MGFYLYLILPAGEDSPGGREDLKGIDEVPVKSLDEGPFRLWMSELEAAPTPSLDAIRAHDAVIRSAMDQGVTPLPMRFGQWFPTRRRLAERLDEKKRGYQKALLQVKGAVELGVRILDPAEAAPQSRQAEMPDSGREYMEALARRRRERQERDERGRRAARELAERLGGLVRRERLEVLEPGEGVVSVAHLVARSDMEAYSRAVDEARRALPSLVLLPTGPWPPYSFVE